MSFAVALLAKRKRAQVERFCLCEAPARASNFSHSKKRARNVGMIGPGKRLFNRSGACQELLRVVQSALRNINLGNSDHALGHVAAAGAERTLVKIAGALMQRERFVVAPKIAESYSE